MFAYFFDEDHPDLEAIFGPQCASKIVVAIEQMTPVPRTRLLVGGLLHNSLVYEVDRITLGGSNSSTFERAQHSLPNYERRLAIICDLAETLTEGPTSFTETEILLCLAKKNIWIIVAPQLSPEQARSIHSSLAQFRPYLGFASVDPGNPLHRRLFLEWLFNDKFVGPEGLVFRRDPYDDDDSPMADEYGSKRPALFHDYEKFDALAPTITLPTEDSKRGELTAYRLSGQDAGHRAKVARELMALESEKVTSPISFSARKPEDRVEFQVPSQKFTDYLLNIDHSHGGPKAKFFIETLGIQPNDWRFLADQIVQAAKSGELYRLKLSPYGASHGSLALITGRNGKIAVVETAWILPAEGPAQFVTAYPGDLSRASELTAVVGRVPPPGILGDKRWQEIHEFAHSAGMRAAETTVPAPMVLKEFGTIWEGPCGFGWVLLRDGRKSFSKWIVQARHGHCSHPGVRIYSKANTQSIEKNRAYADAYAEVLRSNGIECSVGSRLD